MKRVRLVALVLAALPLGGCSVGGQPDPGFPSPPGLGPTDDEDPGMDTGEEDPPGSTGDPDPWPVPTGDETTGDGSTPDEPGCLGDCVERCWDGLDEDGDGAIDCDDSDCTASLACTCTVVADQAFGMHVLCDTLLPWEAARDACEASDMHLVTIDGPLHNAWLAPLTQELDPSSSWWMGYSDLQAEGTWAWVDGTPVGYEHWYPGEPNNGFDAPEHCAAFPEHDAYSWNDLECSMLRPYVCEPY